MLASGLTLIFSMMGVLNFAHASFYMLGAYFAYQIMTWLDAALPGTGFWIGLVLAPLLVRLLGAVVDRYGLRRVRRWCHVPGVLFSSGLTYIMVEMVQITWGRSTVPYVGPDAVGGARFTLFTTNFPVYRAFVMGVAIFMLVAIWLLL